MTRYLITLFVLNLIFCTTQAQEKVVEIDFDEEEFISHTANLKENGFIFMTKNWLESSKKGNWTIRHYSSQLDLKLEVAIEKDKKGLSSIVSEYFLASPKGKFIYHIAKKLGSTAFGKQWVTITQVTDDGTIKTFEWDKEILKTIDFEYKKDAAFADNKYLYIITSKFLKGKDRNKKQLILNKFSHDSFTLEQIEIKHPLVKQSYNFDFWYYRGHTDGEIYLVGKERVDRKIVYTLLTIDRNGEVVKESKIDLILEDEKYILPSFNIQSLSGGLSFTDKSVARVGPDLRTFSSILIDSKNNSIFIYGLFGLKEYDHRHMKKNYEGFFLHKYNLKGELLWKTQNVFSTKLSQRFIRGMNPHLQYLLLSNLSNGDLVLHLAFKKTLAKPEVHSLRISKEGQFIEQYYNMDVTNFYKSRGSGGTIGDITGTTTVSLSYARVDFDMVNVNLPSSIDSKAREVYQKKIKGGVNDEDSFRIFSSNNGYILMEEYLSKANKNNHKVILSYFNE